MHTILTPEHLALIDALLPLATPAESEGLRQYRAGRIQPADLTQALTMAARAVTGHGPAFRPPRRRPAGAPVPTDAQRAEIRRLAVAADLTL